MVLALLGQSLPSFWLGLILILLFAEQWNILPSSGYGGPWHVLLPAFTLGAFFMATDLVTSPSTRAGKLIFGASCGVLTSLTRSYGGFPEGVCYSILFMNCLTPLIDKYVQPRIFGAIRTKAAATAG